MDRKEVCAKIRELNLQDAVKQHYGDNYTRVSTDKLESLIKAYQPQTAAKPATTKKAEAPKPQPEVAEKTKPAEKKQETNVTDTDNPYEAACLTFLGLLKDSGLLEDLLKKL